MASQRVGTAQAASEREEHTMAGLMNMVSRFTRSARTTPGTRPAAGRRGVGRTGMAGHRAGGAGGRSSAAGVEGIARRLLRRR